MESDKVSRNKHLCDACDLIFVTRKELRAHKSTCDLKCDTCKYCAQKFSSFAGVRLHIRRKHKEEEATIKAPITAMPEDVVLKLMLEIETSVEPGESVLDAMVRATGLNKDQLKYRRSKQAYRDKVAEIREAAEDSE